MSKYKYAQIGHILEGKLLDLRQEFIHLMNMQDRGYPTGDHRKVRRADLSKEFGTLHSTMPLRHGVARLLCVRSEHRFDLDDKLTEKTFQPLDSIAQLTHFICEMVGGLTSSMRCRGSHPCLTPRLPWLLAPLRDEPLKGVLTGA
ncbi:hypothetical protein [Streptomyces sp. NPDC002644]